jgi:hypothetical protein
MAAMGGLGHHPGWNQPPPQFGGGPLSSGGNIGRPVNASAAAADGPAPINLRLLLSADEVQYLFGAEEQLLGQLRQQTGAALSLTEPGAHERVLTLTGPLDTVFKAGLEKTRGFFYQFFWGYFWLFWVFLFFFIFAQTREFLGFFQFQEYF